MQLPAIGTYSRGNIFWLWALFQGAILEIALNVWNVLIIWVLASFETPYFPRGYNGSLLYNEYGAHLAKTDL